MNAAMPTISKDSSENYDAEEIPPTENSRFQKGLERMKSDSRDADSDHMSRKHSEPSQKRPHEKVAKNKSGLKQMMASHIFKSYSEEEITTLAGAITDVVTDIDRYPRFGGMCWMFLRSQVDTDIVNWTDSLPLCTIDKKTIGSLWQSTDVDSHDAAGVFGHHNGQNKLLSVGVILKADLEELFTHVHLDERDRNRTGFTSALYAAWQTDALLLKVSEGRKITMLAKHGSDIPNISTVMLVDLITELTKHLSA